MWYWELDLAICIYGLIVFQALKTFVYGKF